MSYFFAALHVLRNAYIRFERQDGWAIASHVALSGLLALFPFAIFATALASFFGAESFSDTAVELIFESWPQSIAGPIAGEVEQVLTVQRGDLLTFSAIAAAIFASNGIEALRVSLNRAYRLRETRNFWFCRLQSLIFVVLATLGMMAISFLIVLAPLAVKLAINYLPGLEENVETYVMLRYGLATGVLTLGLFSAHLFLPSKQLKLREIFPGIALTLLIWFLSANLFAIYLERYAYYISTYAGLASIMVALIFLYIIGVIFIYGAEVNAALQAYKIGKDSHVKRV